MILTGMKIKEFSGVEYVPGSYHWKGKTPNLSYILDLASRLLLNITGTKAESQDKASWSSTEWDSHRSVERKYLGRTRAFRVYSVYQG